MNLSAFVLALATHRSEEAFKYLLTRTEVGTEPARARPSLVRAIKQSAEWQDDRNKKFATEKLGKRIYTGVFYYQM